MPRKCCPDGGAGPSPARACRRAAGFRRGRAAERRILTMFAVIKRVPPLQPPRMARRRNGGRRPRRHVARASMSARRGIPAGPRRGTANFNDVCSYKTSAPPPAAAHGPAGNGGRRPRRHVARASMSARRGIPAGPRRGTANFNDVCSYKTSAPPPAAAHGPAAQRRAPAATARRPREHVGAPRDSGGAAPRNGEF